LKSENFQSRRTRNGANATAKTYTRQNQKGNHTMKTFIIESLKAAIFGAIMGAFLASLAI